MTDLIQVQDTAEGVWQTVEGMVVGYTPTSCVISVGTDTEFAARLSANGIGRRYLLMVGDPVGVEGVEPVVWRGVVETWQPNSQRLHVTARAATTIEDLT